VNPAATAPTNRSSSDSRKAFATREARNAVRTSPPVRAENLIRFDLLTESLNVGGDGRADILPLEPGRLDLQAQEPTCSRKCRVEAAADRAAAPGARSGPVHHSDRLFFIQLYRWFPSVLKAMTIMRPETVIRWQRADHHEAPTKCKDLAEPVKEVLDLQGRSRQYLAKFVAKLAGTHAGGFVLTRNDAGGKWSTATYALRKTTANEGGEHRGHRGHRGLAPQTPHISDPKLPPTEPPTPL